MSCSTSFPFIIKVLNERLQLWFPDYLFSVDAVSLSSSLWVCLDAGRSSSQRICVFSGISAGNFCRMETFSQVRQRGWARVNEHACVSLTLFHGSSKLSSAIYRHTLSPILSFSLSPIINLTLSHNSLHKSVHAAHALFFFSMHVCIRKPPRCRFVGHAWAVCLCDALKNQ